MESLLDLKTALQFVEKVGVLNGEELMKKDPLVFIKKLILGYQEHIPFQGISTLSEKEEERHVPTLQEVVEAVLTMEGGLCYTLNTFMCLLLRTLNFNAELLDGNYSTYGDSHSHVVILLSNLRHEGDNFIVDVGCGFPFQDPIPVNEIPCSRYFAGHEYRYEWRDNMILRLHRSGDDIPDGEKPVMRGEWRQIFHFNLNPVSFDYFKPFMKNVYVDESDFHRTLRAIRFPPSKKLKEENYNLIPIQENSPEVEMAQYEHCPLPDLEAERIMIAFRNQSLLIGPMDSATKLRIGAGDWINKILEHFPTIPSGKVDAAVRKIIDRATVSNSEGGGEKRFIGNASSVDQVD